MTDKKLSLKPAFVKNQNVGDFLDLMGGLERDPGEGRLACVYGRAGRGKTRTAQWWHADHDSVYLRVLTVWTPKAFLAALGAELGLQSTPWSLAACFAQVCDRLIDNPAPVFLDEIEKLSRIFLEIIRDLTDLSAAPFILIGEEELHDWMRRERRVWSRTAEMLQFRPMAKADIIKYGAAAAGVTLSAETAGILHKASGGDLRIIKRDLGTALRIANSKRTAEVSLDIAKTAVRAGIRGQ